MCEALHSHEYVSELSLGMVSTTKQTLAWNDWLRAASMQFPPEMLLVDYF